MKRPGQARRSNWRSVRLTEREQIAQTLQQRHRLQWHGLCIGSLTLLALDYFPEQSITRVIVGTPGNWTVDAKTFGELDEITASELIRDLEGLRG